MHFTFFIELAVGYLIGSIPFGYIVSRWKHGIDIRKVGSGNVGARNVLEVTQDKSSGMLVLILDLLKGAVPVLVLLLLTRNPAIPWVCFAIVLGHCYPVWLRFRGGRGLATAAGVLLVLSPAFLVLWLILYWLSSKIRAQVHLNSLIALVGVGLAAALLPLEFIGQSDLGMNLVSASVVKETVIFVFVVLLSRHLGPVLEYFRSSGDQRGSSQSVH